MSANGDVLRDHMRAANSGLIFILTGYSSTALTARKNDVGGFYDDAKIRLIDQEETLYPTDTSHPPDLSPVLSHIFPREGRYG